MKPFDPRNEFKFEFVEESSVVYKAPNIPFHISFFAGTLAGIISRTATAPLDRLKLLMQYHSRSNITHFITKIMEEGTLSFWRGNLTNCVKMAPEYAIKFSVQDQMQEYLKSNNATDNLKWNIMKRNFIGGAVAGLASQTLVYPLEIAKSRLAIAPKGMYRNFYHCIYNIYKNEGINAIYHGWKPSVIGIIPYSAFEMGTYFFIRDKYIKAFNTTPNIGSIFVMAGASSAFASLTSYPFQLVRTKLQMQGIEVNTGKILEFDGMIDCFKKTYKKFGFFKGFYSGLLPSYMKSVPAAAISYFVVEKTRQFFVKHY